jgi:hypothetical protein
MPRGHRKVRHPVYRQKAEFSVIPWNLVESELKIRKGREPALDLQQLRFQPLERQRARQDSNL